MAGKSPPTSNRQPSHDEAARLWLPTFPPPGREEDGHRRRGNPWRLGCSQAAAGRLSDRCLGFPIHKIRMRLCSLYNAQGCLDGLEHVFMDAAQGGVQPMQAVSPPTPTSECSAQRFCLLAHFFHKHFLAPAVCQAPALSCQAENPGSLGRQTQARETATCSSISHGRHAPLPGMSPCPQSPLSTQ